MSRSGYTEDIDNWQLIKWRGQVASALRGSRGQRFLRELIAALDAMPVKELIAEEFQNEDGSQVCALGALGQVKGIDLIGLDPYDHEAISNAFDIAPQLAAEVMFENDELRHQEPVDRWRRVRRWAESHLKG